jgi:hypothetical protein
VEDPVIEKVPLKLLAGQKSAKPLALLVDDDRLFVRVPLQNSIRIKNN